MSFVDHEHVVETLPPNRSDQPLDERILPRRARCDENLLDSHAAYSIREAGTVDPVSVTNQIPGRGVIWERLDDLLRCPTRRRMICDVETSCRPSMVAENRKQTRMRKFTVTTAKKSIAASSARLWSRRRHRTVATCSGPLEAPGWKDSREGAARQGPACHRRSSTRQGVQRTRPGHHRGRVEARSLPTRSRYARLSRSGSR